jgi:hypothetical protein
VNAINGNEIETRSKFAFLKVSGFYFIRVKVHEGVDFLNRESSFSRFVDCPQLACQ